MSVAASHTAATTSTESPAVPGFGAGPADTIAVLDDEFPGWMTEIGYGPAQMRNASGETCPSWCAGRHAGDGCHLAAARPSWCSGHPGREDELVSWGPDGSPHASVRAEVILSLAKPFEQALGGTHPDYIQTWVWQVADAAPPVVASCTAARTTTCPT
jgi:hypothetical protein